MSPAHPTADGAGSIPEAARSLLRAIDARAREHRQAFFAVHAASLPAGEPYVDRVARLTQLQQDPLSDPYDATAARRWARLDLEAYRRLPAGQWRTDAALQLAENLERSPGYAQALHQMAPAIESEVRWIDQADRRRMDRELLASSQGGRVVPARESADTAPRGAAANPRQPLPVRERFDVQWGLTGRVYRFRDSTHAVALEEGWRELRAHQNTPAVAKAIVDRAIERGWRNLRVTGSDEFERQVRRVGAERGVAVLGPAHGREAVVTRSSAAADEREPGRAATGPQVHAGPPRAPALRALEMHLSASSTSPKTRHDVMTRAAEVLGDHRRQGRRVLVPVLDVAAQARARAPDSAKAHRPELDRAR